MTSRSLAVAFLRSVTESYVGCLAQDPRHRIDVDRAREQQDAYRRALLAAGFGGFSSRRGRGAR